MRPAFASASAATAWILPSPDPEIGPRATLQHREIVDFHHALSAFAHELEAPVEVEDFDAVATPRKDAAKQIAVSHQPVTRRGEFVVHVGNEGTIQHDERLPGAVDTAATISDADRHDWPQSEGISEGPNCYRTNRIGKIIMAAKQNTDRRYRSSESQIECGVEGLFAQYGEGERLDPQEGPRHADLTRTHRALQDRGRCLLSGLPRRWRKKT